MQKIDENSAKFLKSNRIMILFLFSIFMCLLVHLWFLQFFSYVADDFSSIMLIAKRKNMIEQYPKNSIFILVWNKYDNILRNFGINDLITCSTGHCVFTYDQGLLYDYTRFDGIIFNEFVLNSLDRPSRRSKLQFYIFSSQKSSDEIPACELFNDNFFNLTFTHRTDSDVLWSYIAVRNLSGAMVAPNISVKWEKSLWPISSEIKWFLTKKLKAVIWLVNDDKLDAIAVEYIRRLQEHLHHYSLRIDVYGQNTQLRCPNNNCKNTIRDKYYFYIAFENSFAVDHVTDIVLNGYDNYAVPIVYGGANYSRFLPPGSYINARNFHPYNLASEVHKAIIDPTVFEEYFRWTNLYTIHNNSRSHSSLCDLCEKIYMSNSNSAVKRSVEQFRRWWNGLDGMKRCIAEAYWSEKAHINPDYVYNVM